MVKIDTSKKIYHAGFQLVIFKHNMSMPNNANSWVVNHNAWARILFPINAKGKTTTPEYKGEVYLGGFPGAKLFSPLTLS
jgi:hypothetical protein